MTVCEADILEVVTPYSEVLVTPDFDSDNGVVVKRPNDTWGVGQAYGSGQAFMLVRDGDRSDPGPAGAVLYRVDRSGNIGTIGGVHVAMGLREQISNGQVAVFIEPFQDVVGLFTTNPAVGSTRDFLAVYDRRDATYPLVVRNNGSVEVGKWTDHRERTVDPPAPLVGMRTYCLKVNGKRQMKVRFPTGASMVVAAEP